MISKNQLKNLKALQQKKVRKEKNLFVAEGPKVVEEFLRSGIACSEIYAFPAWIDEYSSLAENTPTYEVNEKEIESITGLQVANRVVAVFETPIYTVDEINVSAKGFIYLDRIADPGNLGTIIRLCDWFGYTQLFLSPGCAETFSPKVVQSSMGSLSRIKVFDMPLEELIAGIDKKLHVFGAFLEGDNLYSTSFKEDFILVLGNESHGISEDNFEHIHHRLTIPRHKKSSTESLNAAVAGSVILSEIFRQQNYL